MTRNNESSGDFIVALLGVQHTCIAGDFFSFIVIYNIRILEQKSKQSTGGPPVYVRTPSYTVILLKNRFVKILSVSLPLLTRRGFLSDAMINCAENYASVDAGRGE